MKASDLQLPVTVTSSPGFTGGLGGQNAAIGLRILIVAETLLYREGLAELLGREPALEVVGTAANVGGAIEAVAILRPDLVLLDSGVEGGQAAMAAMRDAAPAAKAVAFGILESEEAIVAWAEAGAAGFVPREATVDQLVTVLTAAMRDEVACSTRVAAALLRRVGALAGERSGNRDAPRLTPRETQIVDLVDEGLSNKEIAARLRIELSTVKNHVHSILEKLGVHRRGQAAARMRSLRAATSWTDGSRSLSSPG